VDLLAMLGTEWMELIAPHRKLSLEFTCDVHIGLRPLHVVGYVLTDLLILCTVSRNQRQTKTPWMLTTLQRVKINQPVNLSGISPGLEDQETATEPQFGVQPPVAVPASRLVNLRLPPEEEMWLEMADESAAYNLCDKLTVLGEAASRQFPGSSTPRSGSIDTLAEKLHDKRAKALTARRRGNRMSTRVSQRRSTDDADSSGRSTARDSSYRTNLGARMQGAAPAQAPAAALSFATAARVSSRFASFRMSKAGRRSQ